MEPRLHRGAGGVTAQQKATYLYCLVRSKTAPRMNTAPRGLAGAGRPRALAVAESRREIPRRGGLWLVVADAPLARYGAAPIERGLRDLDWVSACAMAHEAVVEHCSRADAVVPMKLFTLFATDERALAQIRAARRRLERVLDRIAGRQEWGIRIVLDEDAARRLARERTPAGAGRRAASGTAFLMTKKAERDAVPIALAGMRREIETIFERLVRHADDARRREAPPGDLGRRLLLDAAFLISASRLAGFKRAVREVERTVAAHAGSLTLTGPWPAYNFVTETL
jgi:hypothetical protein